MLKIRDRRRAEGSARAERRLREIETSITGLGDEDLLDLADIFRGSPPTPLNEIALAEMARRDIHL